MAGWGRSVYTRGSNLFGQLGKGQGTVFSGRFAKIDRLSEESIEEITANYFGSVCSTSDNRLIYWGWTFAPDSALRYLSFLEDFPFLDHFKRFWTFRRHTHPTSLHKLVQPIQKLAMGNAFLLALDKEGKAYGLGSNAAVPIRSHVGRDSWERVGRSYESLCAISSLKADAASTSRLAWPTSCCWISSAKLMALEPI